MSTCRRRRQCPEVHKNGVRCKYFHHPLLHFEETQASSTDGSSTADGTSTADGSSVSGRVSVASVTSNEALLPLLTVDVLGKEKTVTKGNVLLDSGAQISLIREEFASELQLSGVPTRITVTKIGGQKEVLQTHKYRVPIREVKSGGKPVVIHAVGIPCISENVSAVNTNDLCRTFNIRQENLHRGSGSVDLLIGVDHAKLHTGEVREAGQCTARKSPVGWVVFGTTPNDAIHTHTVLHVKLTTDEWKEVPEFLHQDEAERPVDQAKSDQEAVEKEKRKVQSVLAVRETEEIIDCTKFSSWKKLRRVTAYVLRFVQIMKSRIKKGSPPDDDKTLSPADLEKAERYWILTAQKGLITKYEKGEYKMLTPFLDSDGVIRVGGRVENLVTSYDSKHPALLPASHHISLLITRSMHELGHHGVATTTAKTRRKFWILQAHRLAKTVKYRCVKCRAAEHRRETQMMANLPTSRVAPYTPPFHFTSCDYFGPYHVKVGRNKRAKYYGVIFTCLNTRAVHLELATDCSTMEFLQVLRRFFAVRGQPAQILSDNGTQLLVHNASFVKWYADGVKVS